MDFYFCTKLCSKANSRVLILNMTMVFQNCCPKHPNFDQKLFLISNLRILIFPLSYFKFPRGYFIYDSSFFSTFSLQVPKYGNFGSKFKDYYFILLRLHVTN